MVYDNFSQFRPIEVPTEGDVKVTVLLSARQIAELRDEARRNGVSVTEVIRKAVDVSVVVLKAVGRGERLLIQSRDGAVREIDIRAVQ